MEKPEDTTVVSEEEAVESKNNSVEVNPSTWNVRDKENNVEGHRNILTRSKKEKRTLSLIDTIISVTLVAPFVVGFWRSIWNWIDYRMSSHPAWIGFALGITVHVFFAFFKERFVNYHSSAQNREDFAKRIYCRIARIVYTYIFGVACNLHWRNGWALIDLIFVPYIWTVEAITCFLLLVLAVMRCVRNLLAPPFVIIIDVVPFVFEFPTRYNANTRDWSLYLLDCAFSVGVVGTLVVFVWRGVWILFDLYLFPEDREYSALGSLAIGYAIVIVTFCLQPLMRCICARLKGFSRLVAADAFLLLSFLGTVNVWRGIWNVLDLWLIPDDIELSCWITHVGCFVFLVLLNCSNSILVRGVYIDAEEDEGKCVVFPCHYLRLFFKIEREKKEARRRNLLLASKDFAARTEGSGKDPENGVLLPNSTNATIIPANPESLV